MTMKYNFDAGDYVETKGGSKGYISNPKTMWWTCTCEGSDGYNEGFLTPLLVWKKIIWHFFIIASEVMILPKRISPIGLNLWTENTPNPSVFTK